MQTQRKVISAIFFTAISFFASAQTLTQPGTVELGGDIAFSSQTLARSGNSVGSAVTTIALDPYIGYMVAEGFELGFMPGLSNTSSQGSSLTTLNLYFAPSYNIQTKKGNVYPYFEFLIGYNAVIDNQNNYYFTSNLQKRNIGGIGVGLDAGVKVNVGGNSLLLLKVQYLNQTYHQDGYSTTTNYGYGIFTSNVDPIDYTISTVSFGVGFRVFFERKPKTK